MSKRDEHLLLEEKYKAEAVALWEAMEENPSIVKSILPLHKNHDVTPDFLSEHLYTRYKEAFPPSQDWIRNGSLFC